MAVVHSNGFSTAVRIFLEVNGQTLRVAQVGETSLILREQAEVQPNTAAQVVIMVDGARRVYPVILRSCTEGKLVHFEDDTECRIPGVPF
jgi:hypothetical protein